MMHVVRILSFNDCFVPQKVLGFLCGSRGRVVRIHYENNKNKNYI